MDEQLDHDAADLWAALSDIVTDGEKRLASHFEAHQLTPPQFYVLKTLSERSGACRIGDIVRAHHLTSATMTGLAQRLEAMQPPSAAISSTRCACISRYSRSNSRPKHCRKHGCFFEIDQRLICGKPAASRDAKRLSCASAGRGRGASGAAGAGRKSSCHQPVSRHSPALCPTLWKTPIL